MRILTQRTFLMIGLVSTLVGCAAGGPRFAPVESIPDDKALVYIYRGKSLLGGAIRYHVAEGDQRIVYLIRGGYYPHITDPGQKTFWARTESKSEVTKDLHPGEIYYLRGRIVPGLAVGRPSLEFMDPETGEHHLIKLKLLPKAEGAAQ